MCNIKDVATNHFLKYLLENDMDENDPTEIDRRQTSEWPVKPP